jgi:transcriptional regulator with XRE-family HTH domain
MPPRTNNGSPGLGNAIRSRRIALNLSIEEAATKAGIGTKTWSRYESGAAIRMDKIRGLCKALGWNQLPGENNSVNDANDSESEKIDETHAAWSSALEEDFGRTCAVSFAIGYDLLHDYAAEDLAELSRLPSGTHIGELGASWLADSLPPQFLTRYDYEFIYSFKQTLDIIRKKFVAGNIVAKSVIEELVVLLIFREAAIFAEVIAEPIEEDDNWRDWAGGIFDDLDVEFFLFSSDILVTPHMNYHFDHWNEAQFYSENGLTSSEQIAASIGTLNISSDNDNNNDNGN